MTEFVVRIKGGERNGELVYWTDDWEHPPIINYDPPIELNSGEGLELITTYDNPDNRFVTFGFLSTDEMMILFGWYFRYIFFYEIQIISLFFYYFYNLKLKYFLSK